MKEELSCVHMFVLQWLQNCRLLICKFQPCNLYAYKFVGYVFVGYEFVSYEFVGYKFSAHRWCIGTYTRLHIMYILNYFR